MTSVHRNTASSSVTSPLRLGIAGLGTVGTGVIRLLREHADLLRHRTGRSIEVVAVSARNRTRDRGIDLSGLHWHDDPVALANDPNVDVVVELMGGAEGTAHTLVTEALKAGKAVVTANKALVARHAEELAHLSHQHGAPLLFEAAVAGGIPAIKVVREGVAADALTRLGGILNGTSNFILTEMAETGRAFEDVLKEAQDKGYAEADPSADIDGWDAAHKLSILTAIAFRPIVFDSLAVSGMRRITTDDIHQARKLGYAIKMLGVARRLPEDRVEAWVQPCLIPARSGLAQVNGVYNALTTEGPFSGPITISGQGAGEGPTADAVMADVIDLARGHGLPLWGRVDEQAPIPCEPVEGLVSRFYLRITLEGSVEAETALEDIRTVLGNEDVAVEKGHHHTSQKGDAQLILLTGPVTLGGINRILPLLEEMPLIKGTPLALKVEDLP
ncbi:homoserine dehydrogenase [Parasaccharibacter sp. TMW2.1882]|uniref:homoserine dehydrogenase n=1 Tax=Acetobacteraceae TaxID=433 RepID=UPI00200B2886|nr:MULTISPECIES: homoserine dehydrogenase [Acetobacteraceae]MCK8637669.1 homoserine dehydrogenase [Parasaccharibacter sp. TMW2.1885]MCL1496928.1 homoserine dehydrogenase [Parasaccharibacter sp. TMW2.1882]MCT6845153.1 homoserine dehydrogenase [Bombella apis]